MDDQPSAVFTLDASAASLRAPKKPLCKLVCEGQVPAQKIGRRGRFRKTAIAV